MLDSSGTLATLLGWGRTGPLDIGQARTAHRGAAAPKTTGGTVPGQTGGLGVAAELALLLEQGILRLLNAQLCIGLVLSVDFCRVNSFAGSRCQ
jgi:hypothetical protein